VSPHHALRHPGGASGVDDEKVVGGTRLEVARVAGAGEGLLVLDHFRVVRQVVRGGVADRNQRSKLRNLACDALDHRRELALREDRGQVRVVADVAELGLDVPIVDVDRNRANLERRQHRFDVLDTVEQMQADVAAPAHSARLQEIREPVRARVELGVRQAPRAADQGGLVSRDVDHGLEKIGDVELHAPFPLRAQMKHVLAAASSPSERLAVSD
jgi:hypothetical protein